jgi:hypothetical protein
MVIEREIWSETDFETYTSKIEEFTTKFGEPKQVKRLALRFGPDNAHHVNTRIRITNGDAKIMQKVHSLERNRATEREIDIPNDAESIVSLFKTYRTILQQFDHTHCYLLRFDNAIFELEDVEIKLTHQFGNEDVYSFEVEALNKEVDVAAKCEELGLQPRKEIQDDAFWTAYNKRVNIDVMDWGDEELIRMIEGYL